MNSLSRLVRKSVKPVKSIKAVSQSSRSSFDVVLKGTMHLSVMLARSTSATYSQDHQGIQWSEHSKLSHLKQVGIGKDVGAACVPHSTSGQGPGLVPGGSIYSGAHLSMFPKIAQARLVLHFH